jgi:Peptidase family C25/Secretion system C-terminal sorting domain/Propeptide_C25
LVLMKRTSGYSPHQIGITSVVLVLLCLLAPPGAQAEFIVHHYDFPVPVIELQGEYHCIRLEGGWSYGAPGEPVLPMVGARILLPPGEKIVAIEVIPGESHELAGNFFIEPGQIQSSLSGANAVVATKPLTEIYQSNSPVPSRLNDEVQVGSFRGYQIATVALHPVSYIPAKGEVRYLSGCDVQITTTPDFDLFEQCGKMIRHDDDTVSRLHQLIDNPSDSDRYQDIEIIPPVSRDLDPGLGYRYLIITTESWFDQFTLFADFLTRRGLPTGVFLNSWIQANYTTGVDEQENIRFFINEAYRTWNIDYLLLGGDARDPNGIPHRGLYAANDYFESEADIPADLYYGCLDGNWNDDGDYLWGEIGEADLYHEIAVGRAAVSQPTHVANFITKTMRYLTTPIVGECDQALMVGELLWDEPTWGGDYKDEIKDGSDAHGYTTAGFPAHITVDTLYDRTAFWNVSGLIQRMETGSHIINHMGHCEEEMMMRFDFVDVLELDNDGTEHTYNFIYSQGCYAGSFDNRHPSGSYGLDCIGEQFQIDEDGAVALILNSRDGWGVHGSTNGSSQYFDREFFDAVFGEGIHAVGQANDDSKMDTIWNIDYGANRYCFYTLNLFGDPALKLWTAQPTELSVSHPLTVYIGEPDVPVSVMENDLPVAGALVVVYSSDYSIYDTAVTDEAGVAMLHPLTTAPGSLQFAVTATNHLPYSGEATVEEPAGAHVVFDSVVIHDSGWEVDGMLDAGETVMLELGLRNIGVIPATGLLLTIETDNPDVNIHTTYVDFPDIPPGSSVTGPAWVEVSLAGDAMDQEILSFEIHVFSAQGIWETGFELIAEAPSITAGSLFINDCETGNCDGSPDPGESVTASLWLINEGHSDGRWLSGSLTSLSNDVIISEPNASCQLALQDNTALLSTFAFDVVPEAISGVYIPFRLVLTSTTGYTTELTFGVIAGTWVDDGETDRGWTLGVPGDDATTGQWERVDPVGSYESGLPCQPEDDHSPEPGVTCFVTGNGAVGGPAGASDVDNGKTTMLSPVFDLNGKTAATLSYWRWYTNDMGANPYQDYWRVQVTNDGINWEPLEITNQSNTSWTYHEFELQSIISLTSTVQVRFVAEDSSYPSLVEAAVDDITLMALEEPLADVPEDNEQIEWGIFSIGPNPLRSRGTIQYRLPRSGAVRLSLFDLNGRVVHSFVNDQLSAGEHTASISESDLSRLSAGIYFLRLETPQLLQLKQISVLK